MPQEAIAVVLTVTAIDPTSPTYVTVDPVSSPTLTSDLNVVPGMNEANLVVATLGVGATITLYNYAGTTNLAIDVIGWYS